MTIERSTEEGRVKPLDSLRGIAVLAVVLYHYTARFPASYYGYPHPPVIHIWHGNLGVQLFFMISGFVITMTLTNCSTLLDFAWKRIARLYPAYWCAIALTFAALSLFGLPEREVRLKDVAINLTMLQTAFHVPDVDGAYWSLFHELFFYTLASAAYFASGRSVTRTLLVLLPLPPLFYVLSHFFTLGFFYYFFIFSLPYFVYGISMFLIFETGAVNRASILGITVYVALMIMSYTVPQVLCLVFSAGLMMVIAFRRSSFLSNRILLFFGTISYSLYLIHQNIGLIIIRALIAHGFDMYLSIAAAFIVVTAIAFGMNRLIEGPARNLLRRWRRRVSAIVATAHA